MGTALFLNLQWRSRGRTKELSEETYRIANNADCEEATDDDQRVDALLEEIHAGEGHQQGNDTGHEAVENALNCGNHMLTGTVVVLRENEGHIDRGPFCNEGAHNEKPKN